MELLCKSLSHPSVEVLWNINHPHPSIFQPFDTSEASSGTVGGCRSPLITLILRMNVDWNLTNLHMSWTQGTLVSTPDAQYFILALHSFVVLDLWSRCYPARHGDYQMDGKGSAQNSPWTQMIKVPPSCSGWGWRKNSFGEPDYKRHHSEPQLLHEWCLFICRDLGFQNISLPLLHSANFLPWLTRVNVGKTPSLTNEWDAFKKKINK